MSNTRPPGSLRGNTPSPGRPPRGTQEYGPTGPVRERQSLPAELSQVNEIIREALAEVFSERSTSAESMIAARVKVDTARGLRNYRGALGVVGTALVGFIGWAVAEVRSYGDERVAAYEAKAEAKQATDRVDSAHARLDTMEGDLDRMEATLARIELAVAARAEDDVARLEVTVPKPKPRAGKRGD